MIYEIGFPAWDDPILNFCSQDSYCKQAFSYGQESVQFEMAYCLDEAGEEGWSGKGLKSELSQ